MKNYFLYIIIGLSLALAIVFFLVIPKKEELDVLKEDIAEKEFELQSEENYVQKLKEIYGQVNEKKEIFTKIDSAMPQRHSLPELLNFFQKTAAQSGLVLEEVVPSASGKSEGIRDHRANLLLKGNYPAFKKFITAVEISARFIEIESVKFSSAQVIRGTGETIFEFEVFTKVYSY